MVVVVVVVDVTDIVGDDVEIGADTVVGGSVVTAKDVRASGSSAESGWHATRNTTRRMGAILITPVRKYVVIGLSSSRCQAS